MSAMAGAKPRLYYSKVMIDQRIRDYVVFTGFLDVYKMSEKIPRNDNYYLFDTN